jgi:S-adenosylmethionine-diacylgycerolhomoserine-N-methlytransferase
MAHSTSRGPYPSAEASAAFGLPALERFYGLHASIYDWTRPFFLYGRRRLLDALTVRPGQRVLDVGSGTGWSLPRLLGAGAEVVAVECSAPMRERLRARARRLGAGSRLRLVERPYGSPGAERLGADRVLFSYSLSMIPPYAEALASARRDLRAGGRIGVVDFLDARGLLARGLAASHVELGAARLDEARRLFPRHRLEVRSAGLWRYYLLVGEA